MVYSNKSDLPSALNPSDMRSRLDLGKMTHNKWFIQSTCATNGEGLYEGLDWLSRELAARKAP